MDGRLQEKMREKVELNMEAAFLILPNLKTLSVVFPCLLPDLDHVMEHCLAKSSESAALVETCAAHKEADNVMACLKRMEELIKVRQLGTFLAFRCAFCPVAITWPSLLCG